MHPPLKNQADGIGTDEPILECDHETDLTRQEDKDDADITKILQRYGVPQRTNPAFGNYDFSIDLQSAMESLTEANRMLDRLPEPLKAKYGTLTALQDGFLTGEFEADYDEHRAAQKAKQQDDDYAARTAAQDRAAARRRESEDREAFERFRERNKNVTPSPQPPEEIP